MVGGCRDVVVMSLLRGHGPVRVPYLLTWAFSLLFLFGLSARLVCFFSLRCGFSLYWLLVPEDLQTPLQTRKWSCVKRFSSVASASSCLLQDFRDNVDGLMLRRRNPSR